MAPYECVKLRLPGVEHPVYVADGEEARDRYAKSGKRAVFTRDEWERVLDKARRLVPPFALAWDALSADEQAGLDPACGLPVEELNVLLVAEAGGVEKVAERREVLHHLVSDLVQVKLALGVATFGGLLRRSTETDGDDPEWEESKRTAAARKSASSSATSPSPPASKRSRTSARRSAK